jgi:hypothetical protein
MDQLHLDDEMIEEKGRYIRTGLLNIQEKRLEYTKKILDLHINTPYTPN